MAKKHSHGRKAQKIPQSLEAHLAAQQTKAGELEDLLRLLDETEDFGYAIGLARRLAKELNEDLDSTTCRRAMEAQNESSAAAS